MIVIWGSGMTHAGKRKSGGSSQWKEKRPGSPVIAMPTESLATIDAKSNLLPRKWNDLTSRRLTCYISKPSSIFPFLITIGMPSRICRSSLSP